MQRDVFCQRDGQIEAQRQIAVALLEAIDLLFRLAAALGQQHVGSFDRGGIQRREAIEAVGVPQNLHDRLHLQLRLRQQLHKPGERMRFDL